MNCPNCNVPLKYEISARKGEIFYKMYKCPKCEELFDFRFYVYTPTTCPKHHWIFDRWNFKDGMHNHQINWVMKCDRCGKTNEEIRWDSEAVGLREAVDMEDPRVLTLLDLNKDTARFHMEPEEVTDFWKS